MTRILKVIFSVCGFIAFVLMVRAIGLEAIAVDLRRMGLWFLAIIALWGIAYLFNTGAWYFILNGGRKVGFGRIFQVCVSGFALNNLTPLVGMGGEPYRAMVLKERLGTGDSLSAVVLYWMLHFLSSFVFWVLVIPVVTVTLLFSVDIRMIFAVTFVFSLAGVWFMMLRHRNGMFHKLYGLTQKSAALRRLTEKFAVTENSILLVDNRIKALYNKRRKDFYLSLLFEVVARILVSLEFVFVLTAIGIHITPLEALYLSAGYYLFVDAFFFIPLQLGAREGGLYLLTGAIGIAPAVGVFMALVMRIRELFWTLVGLLLVHAGGISAKRPSIAELIRNEEADAK